MLTGTRFERTVGAVRRPTRPFAACPPTSGDCRALPALLTRINPSNLKVGNTHSVTDLRIVEQPNLSDAELNDLFEASWPKHEPRTFGPTLKRSLTYFAVYLDSQLVGFVNVAWDGAEHALLLDATVRPGYRRRGIGLALVVSAATSPATHRVRWLRVDYEPHLESFYFKAGFRPNAIGVAYYPLGTPDA